MPEYLPKQGPLIRQQSVERRAPPIREVQKPKHLKKGEFGDYGGVLYRGLGNGRFEVVGAGGAVTPAPAPPSGGDQTANDALALALAHHGRHENPALDQVDHGGQGGLGDDDHAQYLNATRHTAIGDAAPHHARAHTIATAADHSDWPAGLDATELGYVNGVTSAIQTQLNAKVDLTSTAPLPPRNPRQVGTGLTGARHDHQHNFPPGLCETMLYRLLTGALNPGSNQDITYVFSNAATADIAVVQTWNGAFSNAATYRETHATGGYLEIVFTGSQVVLWSHTDHSTTSCDDPGVAVTLDSVAQTAWNQITAASYSLTGLSYGVHTLRLTRSIDTTLFIGHIIPREYAYAGVGVQNDAIETSYVYPRMVVTSIGRGPTAGAGGYPSTIFGQSIVHRCPLSTDMATDYLVSRAALEVTGYTALSRGFIAIPGLWHILHGSASGWARPGLTLTLGAAAIRGRRGSANIYGATYTNYLTASTNHLDLTCGMGRVTAIGAGSVLAVNQLVFWVQTYGRSAAATTPTSAWQGGTPEGCDFFAIPGDLL